MTLNAVEPCIASPRPVARPCLAYWREPSQQRLSTVNKGLRGIAHIWCSFYMVLERPATGASAEISKPTCYRSALFSTTARVSPSRCFQRIFASSMGDLWTRKRSRLPSGEHGPRKQQRTHDITTPTESQASTSHRTFSRSHEATVSALCVVYPTLCCAATGPLEGSRHTR